MNSSLLTRSYLFIIIIGIGCVVSDAVAEDRYLQGYLSAILEHQLGWNSDSYRLKVEESYAIIRIRQIDHQKLVRAKEEFSKVPQLVGFDFLEDNNTEESPSRWIHYPRGDYFIPMIADVREPQFFVSFVQTKADHDDFLMGMVGLGQNFGLYRWPTPGSGDGWQLSFFAGLFSQFNMDTTSDDLLNSDYIVGFPLSFRRGNFSGRFRLLHLSSHLGDELLLSGQAPPRVNLSVEAIDMTLAYDIGNWRGVIGALKIVSHDPSDLEERIFGLGLDYRNPTPVIGNSRFIAGIYTEWVEEIDWDSGLSLKFGLEVGQTYPQRHGTRYMFEAYKGFSPFGQFFVTDIEYYGVGVYFDFN